MTRLVFDSQFLIRCPSSRMIRSHAVCSMASKIAQHLLVVADREETIVGVLLRALGGRPATSCTSRSQKRWISLRHCDLSDAGQMISTLRMSASRGPKSATPTPWIVLPSPMSSARIARPAPAANAMPSN